MKSGVQKVVPDHRNYSFHRTFGSAAPETFADSLNLDAGFPIANQDTDGFPFGCTSYAQTGIAQDEDKRQYIPKFTYDETLNIEGIFQGNPLFETVGCSVTDSLNSTIVYGLQALGETPATVLNYRRGAYFQVEQVAGLDFFDSIRSCMAVGGRSVSVATPWYNAFATPQNGIANAPGSYNTTFASWHNHKICGWTTINGVPYLIDASWQGQQYGINGFVYFSREIINQLMSISGSGAFTVASYVKGDINTVRLTLWEMLLSYARMLLADLQASTND